MSDRTSDSIRLLQELARAAGASGEPIHADVPAAEYDWDVPCHYNTSQVERLAELGASLVGNVARALGKHLCRDVALRADSPAQQFGSRLAEQIKDAPSYQVVLSAGEAPCGLLLLNAGLAVGWVDSLLGGGAEGGGDRELSELESDLLADTVAVLVEAVSGTLQKAGGGAIGQRGRIAPQSLELPGDAEAVWCVFGLRTDESADTPSARLALLCGVLDDIVLSAQSDVQASEASSDTGAVMTEHFAGVPVTTTVIAAEAELTVREVMDLEAGDVVLLPKYADEPFELHVAGKAVLTGRAVLAAGQYGVEILGVCDAPEGTAVAADTG